jgi:hypothetical protein
VVVKPCTPRILPFPFAWKSSDEAKAVMCACLSNSYEPICTLQWSFAPDRRKRSARWDLWTIY